MLSIRTDDKVRGKREMLDTRERGRKVAPDCLSVGRGCVRSREGLGWLKVQARAEFSIITQERECSAGTFLRVSGLWGSQHKKEAQSSASGEGKLPPVLAYLT